jgi:hypothetical protein
LGSPCAGGSLRLPPPQNRSAVLILRLFRPSSGLGSLNKNKRRYPASIRSAARAAQNAGGVSRGIAAAQADGTPEPPEHIQTCYAQFDFKKFIHILYGWHILTIIQENQPI